MYQQKIRGSLPRDRKTRIMVNPRCKEVTKEPGKVEDQQLSDVPLARVRP
jgi:hypothetical protein